MSNLNQLQQNFQNYLMLQDSSIQHHILNTEKVSIEQRLNIYRDAYSLRLLEVLTLDYPVLHTLLGHEAFETLGYEYLAAYPSTFQSVRWFGDALPAFVEKASIATQPVIAEMAYFEHALSQVFDERDCDVVTLEQMAAIPFEQWPMMHFQLVAAFRRLNVEWNIVPIWNAVNEEQTPVVEKSADSMHLLIWRREREVQFCTLTSDEAYMVDAMYTGKTFAEICEGLCEWVAEEEVAMHAATLLKRFILDELISAINF